MRDWRLWYRNLEKQNHITYPSLTEEPAAALKLGDIRGIPVTFVFNPKGQLANLYGGQTAQQLNQL